MLVGIFLPNNIAWRGKPTERRLFISLSSQAICLVHRVTYLAMGNLNFSSFQKVEQWNCHAEDKHNEEIFPLQRRARIEQKNRVRYFFQWFWMKQIQYNIRKIIQIHNSVPRCYRFAVCRMKNWRTHFVVETNIHLHDGEKKKLFFSSQVNTDSAFSCLSVVTPTPHVRRRKNCESWRMIHVKNGENHPSHWCCAKFAMRAQCRRQSIDPREHGEKRVRYVGSKL